MFTPNSARTRLGYSADIRFFSNGHPQSVRRTVATCPTDKSHSRTGHRVFLRVTGGGFPTENALIGTGTGTGTKLKTTGRAGSVFSSINREHATFSHSDRCRNARQWARNAPESFFTGQAIPEATKGENNAPKRLKSVFDFSNIRAQNHPAAEKNGSAGLDARMYRLT